MMWHSLVVWIRFCFHGGNEGGESYVSPATHVSRLNSISVKYVGKITNTCTEKAAFLCSPLISLISSFHVVNVHETSVSKERNKKGRKVEV